ncbi:MAG: alpha/beta hydrolase [Vitreimonas sp.]
MRYAFISLVFLFACASTPPPAATPASEPTSEPRYDENWPCSEVPATSPVCRESVSDVDEAAARAALGDRELAILRDGDRFTVFARTPQPETRLCCSLQGPMTRIGETDLFVARYRLADLDRATLSFIPPAWLADGRNFPWEDIVRWRGLQAPPAPASVEELRGERFERTLWSEHLQETRRIFFYLPPGHDRAQTYPALFMADGAGVMTAALLVERMIDDGLIPPIVLVGAGSGAEAIVEDRSSLGIADLRGADYLPGFDGGGDRFEQHLRFFSEELVAHAMREFGVTSDPQRRAVTGFSNGGSFAVFAALRRPDVFGVSIPLSPGWRRLTEEDFVQPARARFFISGGLYEIARQRSAGTYAEALRAHGYEVALEIPAAGHFQDQEDLMIERFLPLAFATR